MFIEIHTRELIRELQRKKYKFKFLKKCSIDVRKMIKIKKNLKIGPI